MSALRVAVFGSSEPLPGESAYERARELGRLLAGDGHTVVTGGYGGVMEAVSRGARERGGRTVGVGCRIFDRRAPNAYLDEIRMTDDLHDRTRVLIELAEAFVVAPGKAGTLAELGFLWALQRAGCLAERPVLLLGTSWTPLLDHLERHGILETAQLAATRVVPTPVDAAARLRGGASGEEPS